MQFIVHDPASNEPDAGGRFTDPTPEKAALAYIYERVAKFGDAADGMILHVHDASKPDGEPVRIQIEEHYVTEYRAHRLPEDA